MSQTAAWSHLPNAPHIDRVLDDLRERTQAWNAARAAAWDAAWHAARVAAWHAARVAASHTARGAAWHAARDAAWGAARGAAWDAVAALVAWDDAGEYLKFSPEHLRVLSAVGDHKATLLLPAALVLQTEPVDQ